MLTVIRPAIWGLFSAGLHSPVQPTPKSAFVASLRSLLPLPPTQTWPLPQAQTAYPPVLCLPQSLCLSSEQGFQDI